MPLQNSFVFGKEKKNSKKTKATCIEFGGIRKFFVEVTKVVPILELGENAHNLSTLDRKPLLSPRLLSQSCLSYFVLDLFD